MVAPRRLGVERVAVVLPTLTWQAYNFRDDDGDGRAGHVVRAEAHEDRSDRPRVPRSRRAVRISLPPRLPALAPLDGQARRRPLAVGPRARTGPQDLRRAYDLIVFAGHHEYVTTREYDLVERYRDLGGNLMFLSANNYYWRVVRRGKVIEKAGRWRDLGRPESALVGVQYRANQRSPRRPWVARQTPARRWLLAGTGLRLGSPFGRGGVEIDHVTSASPPRIQVLAEIPNIFGHGKTAQMTYYETAAGARVSPQARFTSPARSGRTSPSGDCSRTSGPGSRAMTFVRDVTRIRP